VTYQELESTVHFRKHRYPTRFTVIVKSAAGQTRCSISNVNETGAKIIGITGLKRGDEAILMLTVAQARGLVQWVTPDKVGIAFQPHLPPHFVDEMRHRISRGKSAPATHHALREMR